MFFPLFALPSCFIKKRVNEVEIGGEVTAEDPSTQYSSSQRKYKNFPNKNVPHNVEMLCQL